MFAPGVEQRGAVRIEGDWSIGIRRLGKIAQGSALRPRYAARMEGRVWPALVGEQRRRACCGDEEWHDCEEVLPGADG